jgi:hypothetical protein
MMNTHQSVFRSSGCGNIGRFNPALPAGHPFTGVGNTYWSSDTFVGSNFATSDLISRTTADAWGVGFLGGVMGLSHKNLTVERVWPVRDPF